MTDRRQFLRLGMTGLVLAGIPMGCARLSRPRKSEELLFSAADTVHGEHTLIGLNREGHLKARITVADRCHGGCQRPNAQEVLLFARRPGRHFYVIDLARGQLAATVEAISDHHFYGHGTFSPDGRYLYATENHAPSGEGFIGIYDALKGYRRTGQLAAGGIGPHELRMHPDGNTLVVALGGIQTHPDYRRIKLNLDTMAPALLLINRHTGEILQRHRPSHHQLSCRHLDISPGGIVIAGYQFQGPQWQTPPLIARLDTTNGEFGELDLGHELQPCLNNYIASIAVHPQLPLTAITAPRGNKLLVINHHNGKLARSVDLTDCAGVMVAGEDGFLVTTGSGTVQRLPADLSQLMQLQAMDLHWDNHLTAVTSL
ncbi:DUF1513 domain-containing protein [Marinobacter mobilis]|uniref:DUF1513 domain-containing protein n=1 Tax=Marinobacter mobilis TaxID=488533 RepID=A0A1H2T0W8_9GAMM|nr:DUF1513 domain-containing protein [Marinobacter mobilis]SDW37450.1 hypothetical protein SAMN04487960_102303 [Marinobacter mobilis]